MPPEHFLLDAGPIVAYFNPRDPHYSWARGTLDPIEAPFESCEPVLAEAFHLLAKYHDGVDLLSSYCASGVLQIDFRLLDHARPIRELMQRYRNLPMDLADACLVLLAELHLQATVITTDRDFLVYRTRNRRQIRVLAPFQA